MTVLASIQTMLLFGAVLTVSGADKEEAVGDELSVRLRAGEYASSTLRRVEHFAILGGDGLQPNANEVLGLVEWRERVVEGGRVLERDVLFPAGELTVRHVERLTADTTRLVWREAAPGIGRSQIVEPEGDQLVIVDWLRSGLERTELEAAPETHFPLALLEALREGERLPNRVLRYWPLTRAVEELRVEAHSVDGSVGSGRRLVEFTRADGTLAGRFLFEGQELEAFQWQMGGPWARRVSSDRHRILRARLALGRTIEASAQPR